MSGRFNTARLEKSGDIENYENVRESERGGAVMDGAINVNVTETVQAAASANAGMAGSGSIDDGSENFESMSKMVTTGGQSSENPDNKSASNDGSSTAGTSTEATSEQGVPTEGESIEDVLVDVKSYLEGKEGVNVYDREDGNYTQLMRYFGGTADTKDYAQLLVKFSGTEDKVTQTK